MKYWGLEVMLCDDINNRFLVLGGAAWKTKRERDAAFKAIPGVPLDASKFIVDVRNDQDIVDGRVVSAAVVERLLGNPVDQLIADAEKRESK